MNREPLGVNFTAKKLLQEHAALSASVEGVAFTPSLDAPPDRPFPFVRFPRLEPGQTFRFNSYHVVAGDSIAQGSFLACDDSGRPHLVRVPPFTMTVPKTA